MEKTHHQTNNRNLNNSNENNVNEQRKLHVPHPKPTANHVCDATWTLHSPPTKPKKILRFLQEQNKNFHTPESSPEIPMALGAPRPVFCQIRAEKQAVPEFQKLRGAAETTADGGGKIVLQPRICTLRSFGSERRGGVIRANGENEVSRFFEILSDYVESSKRSHDFEIISGRLAMIVFAATVSMEIMTGNSLFRKMDLQGIEKGAGVCLAAVTSAAIFAWFSSNRNRVGRIFTINCNTFIDALIDQIVDGLFYETDISDWSE